MKKNYGFKEGDRVIQDADKGTILTIYKAGKNGLGFLHAEVKYDYGKTWLTALSNLKMEKNTQ